MTCSIFYINLKAFSNICNRFFENKWREKFKSFFQKISMKNHETPPPHALSPNIVPQLNPIKRNKDFIASVDFRNVTERFNGTSPPLRAFSANGGGMKVMKILISQPRIIMNRNLKFLTPRFVKFYENSDLNGLLECAKVACYYGKQFEYTLYSFFCSGTTRRKRP